MLWIRGLQIPWFDKSNLFLRRIANPSKLQATFKNTLHPSQKWCKYLCMSFFSRVKSGLREFSGIMQKLFPYKKYQVGVQFLQWF